MGRLFSKKKKNEDLASMKLKIEKDRILIPLMKFETSPAIMLEIGVTTINFFDSQDIDYNISLKNIKDRMKLICEANPFLVGRIVKDRKKHNRLLCAVPKEISEDDIDAIFFTKNQSLEKMSSSVPYSDIGKIMDESGAIVKTGHKLVNKDDRMAKLTFVPVNDGKEYALCFSLAHVVADGFTYYKILSMLSPSVKIESLQMERLDNFEDVIDEAIGVGENKLLKSPFLFLDVIAAWAFCKSKPTQVAANFVDKAKIAKTKAAAKSRHPCENPNFYVSTNDIISSTYAMETGAEFFLMALNLRSRVKNVTESHAGNYESFLYYDKESIETSDAIRKSLMGGPPFKRCSGRPIPSLSKQIKGIKKAFITSWAFSSFDADLCLWNSEGSPSSLVQLHLPVYNVTHMPPLEWCIVFKPRKGELAVIFFYQSKSNCYERIIANGELLGEKVNAQMFVG